MTTSVRNYHKRPQKEPTMHQKFSLSRGSSPQPRHFPSATTTRPIPTQPFSPTIEHVASKPRHSKRWLPLPTLISGNHWLQNPSRINLLLDDLSAHQPLFQQNESSTSHKRRFRWSQRGMHSGSRSYSESCPPLLAPCRVSHWQQTSFVGQGKQWSSDHLNSNDWNSLSLFKNRLKIRPLTHRREKGPVISRHLTRTVQDYVMDSSIHVHQHARSIQPNMNFIGREILQESFQ